jgi:hypothetical protein
MRAQVLKRRVRPYIPDFKLAFDHVCIHTGGRGVVEEIEKQLSMTPALMQPSKDTLFRYGNTSSSSIWCPLPPSPSPVPRASVARHVACLHASCKHCAYTGWGMPANWGVLQTCC